MSFDRRRMKDIQELRRLASPAPKPQALAWDGGTTLWMGSRETKRIYAINPTTWTVDWEAAAPGTVYGMAVMGKELRVLCGETDDNRIIRRCIPREGFDTKFKLPCPNDTGSQLGFDGRRLFVSQWYPKKLIELGEDGRMGKTIDVPHEICGQVYAEGCFYLLTTDDETTNNYWLTRFDPRTAVPKFEDIARIPFAGRALAFDGRNFWTNHREQNEIVSFARP
jgi:hypothetical protein